MAKKKFTMLFSLREISSAISKLLIKYLNNWEDVLLFFYPQIFFMGVKH